MSHRVIASIDRSALAHNLSIARRQAPQSKVVAMIKADAYGHGLVACAEALHNADVFGVTDVEEAEKLRRAGVHKPIVVLQGLIDRSEIRRIAQHNLQLVVHRAQDLEWLEQDLGRSHLRHKLTLWLKIDTGMGRLGIALDEVQRLHLALRRQPWVEEVILMTHLANASMPESPLNAEQLLQFARCCQPLAEFTPETSIAASAALLALDTQGDYIRPGIMLYGSSPFAWREADRRREIFDLRNVMTLQARLIGIHHHKSGDNIGYNSQFICPTPMRVGIVSIGYADGYPMQTPNGCPVLVGTQRSMTVGRVSMDMLAIDLTHLPDAQLGDLVTLWGKGLCIDEVAAHIGVISYQLTCQLSQRVPRSYQ